MTVGDLGDMKLVSFLVTLIEEFGKQGMNAGVYVMLRQEIDEYMRWQSWWYMVVGSHMLCFVVHSYHFSYFDHHGLGYG